MSECYAFIRRQRGSEELISFIGQNKLFLSCTNIPINNFFLKWIVLLTSSKAILPPHVYSYSCLLERLKRQFFLFGLLHYGGCHLHSCSNTGIASHEFNTPIFSIIIIIMQFEQTSSKNDEAKYQRRSWEPRICRNESASKQFFSVTSTCP